jgi:hypothetical protein
MVATRAQRKADPSLALDEDDGKKRTLWARYQSLLVRRPLATNLVQAGLIAGAGNVTSQLISSGAVEAWGPVAEQVLLSMCFIAPVVQVWLRVLGALRLHWVAATLVDQFLFSPCFNVAIFFVITAAFQGGVTVSAAGLALDRAKFPALTAYEPVWSTQATAYRVWLPATLVREAFVPPHLKALFSTSVAFVWNIVFAFILKAM